MKKPMYPNFDAELARNGMTYGDIASACGVSRTSLYNWLRKDSIPAKWAAKIEEILNRDADYLFWRG